MSVTAVPRNLARLASRAGRGRRAFVCPLLAVLLSLAVAPARGQLAPPGTGEILAVDLELVLAVDVSFSMGREEQRAQREGYVAAFRDPAVAEAIRSGPLARIAVTYVEWGGIARQLVPWTVVDGKDSAEAFARRLEAQPITHRPFTSISRALAFSKTLLQTNAFISGRRTIDISGDGPDNSGVPAALARDKVVEEGIVVNGLPVLIDDRQRLAPPGLDVYYRECVIGGPGTFMLTIRSAVDFRSTILEKLLREISTTDVSAYARPRPLPVAASAFDCLAYEDTSPLP